MKNSLLGFFLFFVCTGAASAAPIDFLAARAYNGGGRTLASADFNSDGKADVVASDGDRVSVFNSSAAGGLGVRQILFTQFSEVGTVAAGDFNSDGRQDVAAAVASGGTPVPHPLSVAIFLGNGSGTFGEPIFSAAGNVLPFQFVVRDFNNDGKADIVYTGGGNTISLILGSGNGTFAAPVTFNSGQSPRSIVAADFNGDNRLDLALRSDTNVVVMPNNGSGGFGAPVVVTTATLEYSVVAVADFNGDGKQDIAAVEARSFNPKLQIRLGNGDLTFRFGSDFVITDLDVFAAALVAGDFNRDNKTDLVLAVRNQTLVFNGAGNGSFAAPDFYAAGGRETIAADFNGDGALDLAGNLAIEFAVAGSNNFGIFPNLGDGTFLTNLAIDTGSGVNDVAIANFNADNLKDLIVVVRGAGGQTGGVAILLQDSTDGGGKQTIRKPFARSGNSAEMQSGIDPITVATGDFNNDGKTDAVIAGRGASGKAENVFVALGNGAGDLTIQSQIAVGGEVQKVITADLNNDNILDIVCYRSFTNNLISVLLGTGGGNFAAPANYIGNSSNGGVAVGDFNADGKKDLAVTRYDTGISNFVVTILLNNGSGGFVQGASYVLPASSFSIQTADLNADGKLDLILSTSINVVVLNGVGNGTFGAVTSYALTTRTNEDVVIADFNTDGKPDAAVLSGTNVVGILLNNGTGILGAETLWAGSGVLRALAADDLNNDGKPDFAVAASDSSGGNVALYFNSTTNAPARARLFDFDGDNRADISVFRPENGAWFVQQSTAGFVGVQFGAAEDKLVPADYDGDGKTDVAVYRPSNGTWYVLRSSAGFTSIQFGATGDITAPADFDGDNKADIAVFRAGNWYYLQSSDNQFRAVLFGQAGDKPLPSDFDADGKADFAVFRPASGAWFVQRSTAGFYAVQFGASGDLTVPADYDGDGKTDFAVFRSGNWFLQQSTNGFRAVPFGFPSDKPVPAAFVQ